MQPVSEEAVAGRSAGTGRLTCEAVPFLARAWWGAALVAESPAAVRVEEPGRAPSLCFPPGDVRLALPTDEGRTVRCPVKGGLTVWSLGPAEAPDPGDVPLSDDWGSPSPGVPDDGTDAVWSFTDPPDALRSVAGFVVFDHDRVRVELVDPVAGEGRREASVKRFPTWGDAADLVDILDVRPDGDGAYVSVARGDHRRPVVEGSQMLGQAIVAAGRHAPGRRAVSAHMVFLRAADARRPLRFELRELQAGRTFTTLAVEVDQDGRRCAAGTLLLDTPSDDVVRHEVAAPEVPAPLDLDPYDMSVTGRDLRVVDNAYTNDPGAPVGPPVLDAWVRFRELPDDPPLHAGLLAQFTGHLSIAAALRPHEGVGQYEAHRSLSTAINAIAISVHADVRADRWMLYHHRSTFAGDGMTHSECRVHDEQGRLLASFTVDAMVRRFAADRTDVDHRTAL